MNHPCAISVDWLQVYTLVQPSFPVPTIGSLSENGFIFDFALKEYHSAMFCDIVEVKLKKMECATIELRPRSSKLNKAMCLIKLSNRILYSNRYVEILYSLMKALHVVYKGITRIDLCYDCNKFADGRSPSRFINNYLTKPDTEVGGYCRKGSDEFICHGKKASGSASRVNYISFGSHQSRVRAYIYDKTIELQEVKDKPWIREMWQENSITNDDSNHVFRSEISIKSEGTDLLNMSTGELFRLSPVYLENQKSIEKLFHYYADKYLHFRINEGQKYRKNYRKLELFAKKPEITCKPTHVNTSHDTGKMEKICYNKLDKLSEQYSDLSEPRRAALQCAMEFLKELEGVKSKTLANERYKAYLNELKGKMFYDQHFVDYFASVEDYHAAYEQLESELTYYEYMTSDIAPTLNY